MTHQCYHCQMTMVQRHATSLECDLKNVFGIRLLHPCSNSIYRLFITQISDKQLNLASVLYIRHNVCSFLLDNPKTKIVLRQNKLYINSSDSFCKQKIILLCGKPSYTTLPVNDENYNQTCVWMENIWVFFCRLLFVFLVLESDQKVLVHRAFLKLDPCEP